MNTSLAVLSSNHLEKKKEEEKKTHILKLKVSLRNHHPVREMFGETELKPLSFGLQKKETQKVKRTSCTDSTAVVWTRWVQGP